MLVSVRLEEVNENGMPRGTSVVVLDWDSKNPETAEIRCYRGEVPSPVRVHLGMLANAVAAMPQE